MCIVENYKMDFPTTQVYNDDDFTPTQKISNVSQQNETHQVGILTVGLNTYFINNGVTTLGRHPSCTVVLNDQTVSKQHAEIEATNNPASAWICDLKSANKTKLNNLVLKPGRSYELKNDSVINLGRLRAVYKFYTNPSDADFTVPETPALYQQGKHRQIIPGTPDSSLNNSSGLEGDLSTIPASQGVTLHRPAGPSQWPSTKINKRILLSDSDDSISEDQNVNRVSDAGDSSIGNQAGVSIYDMETQKPLGAHDNVDIHDMETQKVCFGHARNFGTSLDRSDDRPVKSGTNGQQDQTMEKDARDIHDMETQQKHIHNLKTQLTDDIYNVKTPSRKENDKPEMQTSSGAIAEGGKEEGLRKKPEANHQINCNNEVSTESEKRKVTDPETHLRTSDTNETTTNENGSHSRPYILNVNANDTEQSKEVDSISQQTKLSLTSMADIDDLDLNESIHHFASQNVLEDLAGPFDTLTDQMQPTSKPAAKVVTNETVAFEKSSEEENIFDMATQVVDKDKHTLEAATQKISNKAACASQGDDSDSDQDGVFLRYLRTSQSDSQNKEAEVNNTRGSQSSINQTNKTGKRQNDQMQESDDSDTDKEGFFTDIALKAKRTSLEASKKQSIEPRNDPYSSADSIDVFDVPTQKNNENCNKDLQSKESEIGIKNDVCKGAIQTNTDEYSRYQEGQPNSSDVMVVDDQMPTQIIKVQGFNLQENSIETRETQSDDSPDIHILPTQLINIPKTSSGSSNEQNCSRENTDYEIAVTQLISDIEEKKAGDTSKRNSDMADASVSSPEKRNEPEGQGGSANLSTNSKSEESKNSKKANLDDTIERNLNKLFDDVNEERVQESLHLSTQSLEKILQSSQIESVRESSVDHDFSMSRKKLKKKRSKRSPTSNKRNVDSFIPEQKRNPLMQSEDTNDPSVSKPTERRDDIVKSTDVDDSCYNQKTTKDSSRIIRVKNGTARISSEVQSNFNIPEHPKSDKNPKTVKQTDLSTPEISKKGEGQVNVHSNRINATKDLNASTIIDESDEDILAGLPEVRISGTLSNPPSPTSSISEYRLDMKNVRSRYGKKNTVSSRKETRSTRKKAGKDKSNHVADNKQISNESRNALNKDPSKHSKSMIKGNENDSKDNEYNEQHSKRSRRTSLTGLRKMQEILKNVTPLRKSTFPMISLKTNYAQLASNSPKQISSVQNNEKSGHSVSECNDPSSVFQVAKDVSAESTVHARAKRRSVNQLRGEKRSLSNTDGNEPVKKKTRRAANVKETPVPATESRKKRRYSADGRESPSIVNYLIQNNSQASVSSSQSVTLSDGSQIEIQPVMIKVVKMADQPLNVVAKTRKAKQTKQSASKMTVETENNASISKAITRSSKDDKHYASQSSSDVSAAEKDSMKSEERQTIRRRGRSKLQILTTAVGDESQEVQMILQSATAQDQKNNTKLDVSVNETQNDSTGSTRTRLKRAKHARPGNGTKSDTTDNTELSDDCDEVRFEVPTKKAKRSKDVKNGSKTVSESVTRFKGRGKQVSKFIDQSNQSLKDSLAESSTDSRDSSITNDVAKAQPKIPKKRGRKPKVKTEVHDNTVKTNTPEDISLGPESIADVSIVSTPSKGRRSLSRSFSTTSSPYRGKQKILFTGVSANEYTKFLIRLGASQVEDPAKCTVLVTDKVRRTVKFLCALSLAIPIVSINWLIDSAKTGKFMEFENYILKDPDAEAKYDFKLRISLERANQGRLLEDYTVILTPNVAPPSIPELKSIISSCGGKPLVRQPTSSWAKKTIILSRDEDLLNARKVLWNAPKFVTIQSVEFLLTGILRQELDFTKYRLK